MLKIEILMQKGYRIGTGTGTDCSRRFNGRGSVVAMAMPYPKLFAAMLCGQIVANHVTPAPGCQMPGNMAQMLTHRQKDTQNGVWLIL